MYSSKHVHPLIASLLPIVECAGGDGGNANCGQPGYGGCSPGFGGDTAYTNDWAGTWQNHRELIQNNSPNAWSEQAATSWFAGYGYQGYLFSPGSPSYNMQNDGFMRGN